MNTMPMLVEEDTDLCVVKTELFDPNVMDCLLRDTASFAVKDLRRLGMYKKNRLHGNKVKVVYEYGKGCDKDKLGRLYVKDGQGLQSFPADMRNPLLAKHYWEMDMENAHYFLMWKLADSWGLKTDAIQQYIRNRDEELKKISSNRRIAKTTFLKTAYGGNIKLYNDQYNDEGVSSDADLTLVRRIEKEVALIVDVCWAKFPEYHNKVAKRSVPKFSLFSLILQTEEKKCLRVIDSFATKHNRYIGVYIHDAGYVEKMEGEIRLPEDIMRGAEALVMEKLGYEIHLVSKPIAHNFIAPDVPATIAVGPSVIVDDTFAAKKFAESMGSHLVLDCDRVYAFDDTTGIWSCEEAFLKRLITTAGSSLIFSQGEKVFNYSGSVKFTNNLFIKLPDVLPRTNDYFKSRIFSSVNKLLFTNGIYDLKTDSFTEGFNPDIIFQHSIPRPFPKTRNREAEAFVRNALFVEPFLKKEIGDTLLHFLCRGLFGDFLMKIILVCIGKGDSSKGTLCGFISAVFGEVVASFNGDSLLLRGDVEATKSNSWVKQICNRRIAFSNEITISGDKGRPINGNLLKTIASGGDEITLRTNFKDEERVVNQSLPALFVNDLPPISPIDEQIRNRLVAIPYSYSFKENPTEPFHKKADNDIKMKLLKQENLDAFIHIAIDVMKGWNGEAITLPQECCSLRDDVAPSQFGNVKDILEEEYDITNDKKDFALSRDIVEYLRSRKIDGSDTKLGSLLTDLGLDKGVKKINRRSEAVRFGIKRIE